MSHNHVMPDARGGSDPQPVVQVQHHCSNSTWILVSTRMTVGASFRTRAAELIRNPLFKFNTIVQIQHGSSFFTRMTVGASFRTRTAEVIRNPFSTLARVCHYPSMRAPPSTW